MAYKKISSIINQVNEKNSSGEYSNVLGVSIDKEFMPSVANIIGTDLKKYYILRKNRFAFNPMHVGRDKKLPIALYREDDVALVSPAYNMFEIIDQEIDKKYMMLLFKTEKFDHLCWFYTDANVRGGLSWEDFCNIGFDFPKKEKQMEIVNKYNFIEKEINNIENINENIQSLINTYYKKIFNKNYKTEKADKIAKITIGKTPPREESECFSYDKNDVKWVSIADLTKCTTYIFDSNEKLTQDAIDLYNVKVIPKDTILLSFKMTVGKTAITTDEMCTNEAIAHFQVNKKEYLFYLYSFLSNLNYEKLGSTSAITSAINSKIIKNIDIPMPDEKELIEYNNKILPLFDTLKINEMKIKELNQLKKIIVKKINKGD